MLRYISAGESHGKGLVAVLDGVPAGLKMDLEFINGELRRRMYGYGRGERMAIEDDTAEIMAGCRKGLTIGSPVGILIKNRDHKIDELPEVKNPRPGHADLAGIQKYGFKDARDVLERASARETASRVAAGAVAKLILKEFGIRILSHVTVVGDVRAEVEGLSFDQILKLTDEKKSQLRCADKDAEKKMREAIDKAANSGDTLGGAFEVVADGVPPGLGSYAQWDRRLDGALARAVMSIPAVKAVSIGNGLECAVKKGSEVHDAITYNAAEKAFERSSNNAGGMEGGVSNGEPVVVKGFMKPIATLGTPMKSVDIDTKKESPASTERADVSAIAACGVVAESGVALELASALLEKFGTDSIREALRSHNAYIKQLKEI